MDSMRYTGRVIGLGKRTPKRDEHGQQPKLQRDLRGPVTRLLVGATVVGVVTALSGAVASWHWTFDLLAQLAPQAFIGLLCVALVSVWTRRPRLAMANIVAAMPPALAFAPLYAAPQEVEEPGGLKVLVANVHTHNQSFDRVAAFIRAERPDIVGLLEVNRAWVDELSRALAGFTQCEMRPRSDNFGLLLCSHRPFEVEVIDEWGPPSLLATIGAEPGALQVLLTHPVPPMSAGGSARRNAQLVGLGSRLWSSRAIVLGDLNATPWSRAYQTLCAPSNLQSGRHGRGLQSSWPTYYPPPMRIPIDHVLHTPDLHVLEHRLGPDVGSDHFPVVARLRVPPG